jgi:hypothetical protein
MKTISAILLFAFLATTSKAQLFADNFNSGFSASWFIQVPPDCWQIQQNFGTGGSDCAMAQDSGSGSYNCALWSDPVLLNGANTLTLSFRGAVVRNNFLAPAITVYYTNSGQSANIMVGRWGPSNWSSLTDTIDEGADFNPPLDSNNVEWASCTATFAPSSNTIALYFYGDFSNGGYVLLDDIQLTGLPSNPVSLNNVHLEQPTVYPNPATGFIELGGLHKSSMIRLTNASGSVVSERQAGERSIRISTYGLAPGIYLLSIEQEGAEMWHKVVIGP